MKKILVYIKFLDGSGQIAEYKLKSSLPFGKKEMLGWIKEQSKKPIESVEILSKNET